MTRLPCHDLFLRLFVHVSKNPPNSPVKRGATPCAGHMVLVARSPFRAAALRMAGQHPRTRRQAGARRPPHLGSLIAVCPEILHLIRRHPPDSLCDESEEHLPCETIWICFFIMVSRLDGLTPAITWLWPALHDGQPSANYHRHVMREEYLEIGDSGPKSRALLCYNHSLFNYYAF
jgi:hypothetical protein